MKLALPEIPEHERTPLVLRLLDLLHQQQQRIAQLEDEIAILKGRKPRPALQPSTLEVPPPQAAAPPPKRPGSDKRSKTAPLTIHREVPVPLPDPPPGVTRHGDEDFIVQDLVIAARNTRYRRERGLLPEGTTVLAPLPGDRTPGRHFGPTLRAFSLPPYHGQRVTQPLLLEQLRQLGIDISAGQLSRLLTEDLEAFHQEKAALLPAGLQVSS